MQLLIGQMCVLCGHTDGEDDFLSVGGVEKPAVVHRLCAEYVPEVYIDFCADGEEMAVGVDTIPKARWKLVCAFIKCHFTEHIAVL